MIPLEVIKNFVEAKITPREFEKLLQENQELIAVLEGDFSLPSYIEESDLYTFVIGQNYSNIEHVFNVQVLLSDFLKENSVKHERNKRYEELFNVVLKVQPKWLNISFDYLSNLMNSAPLLNGKELQAWIKEEIKNEFRCLKSPPKWLQAPCWPLEDGKPLIFVGQLDAGDLMHDTSCVYVFFNPANNTFSTLTQSC